MQFAEVRVLEIRLRCCEMDATQEAQNIEAFRQAVVNTLDYRLPGCAVKSNVIAFWRQNFVLEGNMLEIDCPCVTPEIVLKPSGRVDKFTDVMAKDEKTGTCYSLLNDYCKDKLEKDSNLSAEKAAELRHICAVLDDRRAWC